MAKSGTLLRAGILTAIVVAMPWHAISFGEGSAVVRTKISITISDSFIQALNQRRALAAKTPAGTTQPVISSVPADTTAITPVSNN